MPPLPPDLDALCRRYDVRRLEMFGSAARGADFDPAHSDIDLLVEYADQARPSLQDFLDLRAALEARFGRKVDLAMASAIRNPFLKAAIAADKRTLYAA